MMMEDVFRKVVTLLSQMVDMSLAQVMDYLPVLENFYLKSELKSAFIGVGKYCFRFFLTLTTQEC